MDTTNTIEIAVRTIHMQPPLVLPDTSVKRISLIENEEADTIISHEAMLRRKAYQNTTIRTDEAFYNDSDMKSMYYLVVVFDQLSNTPLLSARYYFHKPVIEKYLRGDLGTELNYSYLNTKFNLHNFPEGRIFLADRLSGNLSCSIYRQNRTNIFSTYYTEIINKNKECFLLLMVRKDKGDKQLLKYLKMGFVAIGSTLHKGKEHSVIIGDLRDA